MQIHLDHQQSEPLVWQEVLDLRPQDIDPVTLLDVSEVRCSGRLDLADPGFRLQMEITYEQTLSCIRCLSETRAPVRTETELMILPGSDAPDAAASERELLADELSVLYVAGETLETEALVVDQMIFEIPMKPLCRPECLGLCPNCGADRNSGPNCCDAGASKDSRWAELASLRDQLQNESRQTQGKNDG